jgi:hypothetical protein
LAARLRARLPTVRPIRASSPAAWTAVVTISVPRGGPGARRCSRSGGGGAARAAAAFVLGAAGRVAVTFERGFAVVVFGAPAFVRAVGRRSPPMRAGRVGGRLPSTLASAAFFDVFFPEFSAMQWLWDASSARVPQSTGYSQWRRRSPARVDFKKYSA